MSLKVSFSSNCNLPFVPVDVGGGGSHEHVYALAGERKWGTTQLRSILFIHKSVLGKEFYS
jgi:hypothetical protein